jgi:hypothetical protein
MKARILCSASPRSTSSDRLHQQRHWQKMPRLWSGAFLLGRGRTRPGSARLDEPRRFSFGSGRFGESAGTIRRRGRKDLRCGQRHTLHARAAERRDPSAILERHSLTRLEPEALNRLFGQRSDDLVNIAVGQDSPKGPPANGPLTSR